MPFYSIPFILYSPSARIRMAGGSSVACALQVCRLSALATSSVLPFLPCKAVGLPYKQNLKVFACTVLDEPLNIGSVIRFGG